MPGTLAIRVICLLLLCIVAQKVFAEENNNRHNLLLTSASREVIVKLRQPCRLWTQQSLRNTTIDIAQRFKVSIWVDRRLDPNQVVQIPQQPNDSTVGQELKRLAESIDAGSGLIENVYLIAPSDAIARIQKAAVVLHGQLSKSDLPQAKLFKSLEWPDITSYRELLEQIEQIWQIDIDGDLPHDLLHAGTIPECSLATQLSILIGGFDLQAVLAKQNEVNSRTTSLSLRKLSENATWQDAYSQRLQSEAISDLSNRYANSVLQQKTSGWIIVKGETNLHGEIVSAGIGTSSRRPGKRRDRQQLYSFSIESELPVEAVLENLSQSFELTLEWSPKCSAADRSRLIQLKVKNATQQKLLELVSEAANLRFEQSENRLIIHPREPTP